MRRCEEALPMLEMISSIAGLEHYPQEQLDAMWKIVLLNQFHDIIPGSSIHIVYETAEAELAKVLQQCNELAMAAAQRIGSADDNALTLFNPSTTAYDDIVTLPADWRGATLNGEVLACDGHTTRVQIPGQTLMTLERVEPTAAEATFAVSDNLVLENDVVRYEFNEHLQLIRGLDKIAKREICADAGNVLEPLRRSPAKLGCVGC